MKRAYTGWTSIFRSLAIKAGVERHELYKMLIGEVEDTRSDGVADLDDRSKLIFNASQIDKHVSDGTAVHLFLQSGEFCEWLITCVGKLEIQHARALQALLGDRASAILHFPSNSGFCSVGAYCAQGVVQDGKDVEPYSALVLLKSGLRFCTTTFNLTEHTETCDELGREFERYARLFCGLGMYFSCFPEMRKQGLPDDLKHPSQHKWHNPICVGISPKVAAVGTHDSPTPHFRVGHFRFLKSEKYTKKRFQIVFVHECFVKGRAETVLEPGQEV